jgi:hypothetical protein
MIKLAKRKGGVWTVKASVEEAGMTMKTQTITRKQVVDLAMTMPPEKLTSWYEYGLFIQNHPIFTAASEFIDETEIDLQTELAAWETASDEDWLAFEQKVQEAI